MASAGNLLRDVPTQLPEELFETLAAGRHCRIERIVSRGHRSPPDFWYDQPRDEWVLVVQGRAGVRFEGAEEADVLSAGDYLHIPAHRRHRVEWTDTDPATVWLAIHFE